MNRGFELMNSYEVMIICLLDGCISKKIPTDIKNKAGGGWPIGQLSTGSLRGEGGLKYSQ